MKEKKKKKTMIIIALILISILAIGGVIILKPKEKTSTPTENVKSIKVPDMVGEVSSVAQEVLEKLGLEVEIEEIVDDSKKDKIGKVYKQNITGKITKKEKIILSVYVSSEEVKMPDVIGMKKDEAKDILEKLGFNVALEEKEGPDYENDIVLSQEAANKEKIVKGSTIKLVYGVKKEKENEKKDKDKQDNHNKNNNNDKNTQTNNPSTSQESTSQPSETPTPTPSPKPSPTPTETQYTVQVSGEKYYRVGYGSSRLNVSVSPSLPSNKRIIWTSSNPNVARVDSNGTVTPVATYGRSIITAKIAETNFQGQFAITVVGTKGDLTGDGIANGTDAGVLYSYFGTNNRVIKSVGDVNNDGVIDQKDVDKILNYYNSGGVWK